MKNIILFLNIMIILGLLFVLTKNRVAAQMICTQINSPSSAYLRGQITDTGGIPNITWWFRWRQQGDIFWLDTPSQTVFVSSVPYNFSYYLTNLQPCTTYEYKAIASNSAGRSEGFVQCFRTACNPLIISCSASPNPAQINQPVTFSSTVNGGNPPYTYFWSGACTGYSANCQTSFGTVGNYTANLTVTDSSGNSRTTQCSVSVQGGLPTVITLPPVATL